MNEQRVFAAARLACFFVPLASLVVGSACIETPASDLASAAPVEVSATEQAVVGGQMAGACQWPSTVSVNAWGSCSGTLIHPRIIVTAAHCLMSSQTNIFFGAGRDSPGAFSLSARCKAGAQGSRGANTGNDWAYCVLPDDDRVKQIPVTPPLVGCEADAFLRAGMSAWVVGFGTTNAEGTGAGIKRQVPVTVNALDKAAVGTLDVGDAMEGACHGDSGGPLYVHLQSGTHDYGYRVVGSTSGAGARLCDCTCSTVYVNIANHVKAIEANENIDVTPCTNAQGAFDPSPACTALLTSPQDGTGTFPGCTVARTTEPINSCSDVQPVAGRAAAGGGGAPAAAGSGVAGRAVVAGTSAAGRGVAGSTAGSGGSALRPSDTTRPIAPPVAGSLAPVAGRVAVATPSAGAAARVGTMTFGVSSSGNGAEPTATPPTVASGCQCSTAIGAPVQHGAAAMFAGLGLPLAIAWRTRRRRGRARGSKT